MIKRLVIFGATGDLTGRYLLPGLAELRAAGYLGDGFQLVAASLEDWTSERFREHAAGWLAREAGGVPGPARDDIVAGSRYQVLDLADPASVAACLAGEGPVAIYLALPPSVFPAAINAVREAGLPPGSRLVLEKPFGEDLSSAVSLNRLLAEAFDEQQIFRVDHFLAMTTVQALLGTRLANRLLEPLWNSAHIGEIEIIWEESLALEGRAGYYDGAGALKDMIQNHLLQILCVVAMEPPVSMGERDLRDRKVDVLRSVRPLDGAAVTGTRRARYTAGRAGGREVPGYAEEEGVDPERATETFAEVRLELDNWRWADTVFRLRTGKAMAADRKEVVVHFRPVPHLPIETPAEPVPNQLRFGLEPEDITLELTGTGPKAEFSLEPLTMRARHEPAELPPYGRLLLDVLTGQTALSIRADEAEQSWRVVTPVLDAWAKGAVPLAEYPAGSAGPPGTGAG
ncbi:MAG: glucose-6-phosphate dehydrogenase [Actinobacteria bacterium]|nr:glucose-6-phosphate dehydrogenase [Actinomycetota bacterium]MBO0786328.1 glucose-6-phosphate dehydrogenase [Actinomycetota bacterium]